jgi:asparagine synthase (glutamine-hydrolysing)
MILRNFDRLSMAHGIEVRMPFMDWRLVTYVLSLPDAAKYQDGRTKAIARHALAGCMPDSVRLSRRKAGFNSPMPVWLNGKLGVWARRILEKPVKEYDELVDRARLIKNIDKLNAQKNWNWDVAHRLWPYINLCWYIRNNE